MKRIFLTTLLVLILSLVVVGPAAAQNGKLTVKGEVKAISGNSLTILSNKGETIVVTAPSGFDMGTVKEGDSVLVKAVAGSGGGWEAQSIKVVGGKDDKEDKGKDKDDKDDDEKPEGSKDNSAYCSDGKQDKPHPLAAKMAERYGVTESWVMGYFCNGYGMGAIMLALKTSQTEGVVATPESLLASRADGIGWGNLWKDLKLIGSEKEGHSPPGLLKKQEKNK